MNALDIVLTLLLGVMFWLGSTQRFIRQLSATLGIATGLVLGIILYTKLAFLAENSASRTVVLGLLTLAAAFISYDVFGTLGRYIERRFWPPKHKQLSFGERYASGWATVLATLVMIWIGGSILGRSSIDVIQSQIQKSAIVSFTQRVASLPPIFQQTASLISPFSSPQTFTTSEPNFSTSVSITQDFSSLDSAVNAAGASVFKVQAWGCNATTTGSGFVAANNTVVTNAHVIAGADRISVQDKNSGQSYTAQVIWFDPNLDVAVLRTSVQIAAKPLNLHKNDVGAGVIGSVLGYPEGGSFGDSDAVILQKLSAKGYDIYNKNEVIRSVYALRSNVVPGNSGGPIIGTDGTVLGLVFGHSTVQSHTGYALTASQIAPDITQALAKNSVVANGACAI